MARWEPWPVIDGAYKDDARPWSAQDTCNWLPTPAEQAGTRSPIMLRTPPGLILHCDLGTGAPVRGQHDVEGLHLVVSGTTLFRVTPAGVATSIGTIPGVGRVSMDHTPHGSGFQVAIANGQSGYVYDTAANTLTQITDPGFPGAVIFQFIDGYLAFLEPFGGFWGHSELNDALSYNTLDRYTAESAPDGIVSLIVSHREVFVLGTRTGEFFRNTGVATGTFQRADGTEMERGICSPYAIARSDNTVKWVGDDGATYRLEGHQPVRISTGPLEQAFAQSNLDNAFAFNWEDKGHNVFYATLPDGHTWGHDAWTQRWHRRASYGLDRWRLATLIKTGGQWIGGDYTNGKLYRLSWAEDSVHEDGQPLVSERTFPVAHDFGNDLIVNGIRLLFDTGKKEPVYVPLAPLVISGDLGDGFVGQSVNFSYAVSGGFPPYGAYFLSSGSVPAGTTLNPDGTITGTRTTAQTSSWVVGITDTTGTPALHADSSQTLNDDVWFMTVSVNQAYRGKYSGDSWTGAPTLPATATTVSYIGGIIHAANRGTALYYYSTDKGATWTTLAPTYDVTGGRMAGRNGFLFLCAGTTAMLRRALPSGAFITPTTNTLSRAVTIVVHNALLVSAFNGTDGRKTTAISADDGATWTAGAANIAVGIYHPILGSNGDRVLVAYHDAADDLVKIKYSTDNGSTWSAVVYTFPTADANKRVVDVEWDGVNWLVLTTTGQLAYSADNGASFTLSASSLGTPSQMTVGQGTGAGRTLVAAAGGVLYSTADHGVTWQTRTDPAGSSNIAGITWVYP